MKKDRHYYYHQLINNKELFNNKEWLKEAMLCSLNKHIEWEVKPINIQKILDHKDFTIQDYLDFISLQNKKIAAELRKLEN